MIAEVIRVGLLKLWHGKLELLLVFVVPVVFFTIFAMIFDKQLGSGKTKPIRLTVVNLDRSMLSQKLLDTVIKDELVRYEPLETSYGPYGADKPMESLDAVHDQVLRGSTTLAIIVPEGWAEAATRAAASGEAPPAVKLLADTSDPVAPKMVEALVQKSSGKVLAEWQADRQSEQVRRRRQAASPTGFEQDAPAELARPSAAETRQGLPVEVVDLLSDNKQNPVVSMYAAGIAVMFLLFSATGNGGSLLEEEENQTLERLMCSRLGMTQLLIGKWLLLMLIGAAQVTVMFIWAQLVFGVDVVGHAVGFTLMTAVTAAAASSLALVLAAACKTRAQLNAVSVILILTMSALGGSMIPRYIMSDSMQQIGRVTFNAWAIDGYTKLFWRDLPATELGPELAVLGGSAIVLLLVARLLATRWETA